MDVPDVKNVFRNPWSIEMFTRLVWTLQIDPKLVYKWVYEHIRQYCDEQDADFQQTIEENFGHKRLVELITMVHEQSITAANAKQVMMKIVDGDTRMPSVIAEEQGFVGGTPISDEVREACKVALADPESSAAIQKYIAGDNRAVMVIVGRIMKAVNRRGDPVVIKGLLEEGI